MYRYIRGDYLLRHITSRHVSHCSVSSNDIDWTMFCL
jgi:hypothetical protein